MPPPNTLSMRNPAPAGKKPFDASNAIDEKSFEKLEENRLKSPAVLPAPSPFFSTEKHINHHGAKQPVFDRISNRLNEFNPAILLGEHIVHDWERIVELSKRRYLPVVAHRNTLNGIDFIVQDREKLLCAIRNAKADEGKKAFFEGSKNDWKKHWALALSFGATEGIGFREIFRPKVIDRPIANGNKMGFDSRFGRDINVDVSALHIAVSEFKKINQTRCNIHIDNLTVTMQGLGDMVGLSPSFLNHLVNELLFKTFLQGRLPDWIIDAFDISLFNPDEGFFRAGVGLTIVNKPHFKWTLNYSVGLNNNTNPEWSGSFKFEKSVATGITITW
jgi:hypothetical protein